MEEKPKPTRWVMWLVIGLLVAYPLSFGPFVALALGGYIPKYIVDLPLYAPLRFLSDQSPPFRALFRWYYELWL